jgi:hypothetical protein
MMMGRFVVMYSGLAEALDFAVIHFIQSVSDDFLKAYSIHR